MKAHGTWDRYTNHGCRCEKCRVAASEYMFQRRHIKKPESYAWEKRYNAARSRALARLGQMFPEQLNILLADELRENVA